MRSNPLAPNSQTPRAEQYVIAWGLLLNHVPDVTPMERSQAKCWLTYRSAEGEVKVADWDEQVLPVLCEDGLNPAMQARWRVSQAMAEVCLQLLHGVGAWQRCAQSLCDYAEESALAVWPPCLLNYVRTRALLAYDAWLSGDSTAASEHVNKGWAVWQQSMSTLPWGMFPFRAMEAMDDLRALQVLSFIGQRLGVVDEQATAWCTPETVCSRQGQQAIPFMRCLGHLSAALTDSSSSERVIFPPRQRWPGAVPFSYTLTDEQRSLWARVKGLGITHVPFCQQSTNLGDDMQGVAALRFLDLATDGTACVERDAPRTWPAGSTVLLCGWWGLAELPAEDSDVRVIVCALHVPESRVEAFRAAGIFARLKSYVQAQGFPAGCRDRHTLQVLQAEGIDGQISGCVSSTLTPVGHVHDLKLAVDATPPNEGWHALTHRHAELAGLEFRHRVAAALAQLGRLSRASAVLTTRLHAALPALALGVPNVRVIVNDRTPNPERWDGYLD